MLKLYLYGITKFLIFCFIFLIAVINHKEVSKKYLIKYGPINIKDVLFINGCHKDWLPHPYRYRVIHQMEQLNAGFLESDKCFYLDLVPKMIRNYRIIILFRCPLTENIEKAINLAKKLNKKVLFDIDDLVIDKKYTNTIPYVTTLSQKEKEIYDNGVERMGKTLNLCQGAITTTKALANELKNYTSEVFINHNVASEEMWKLSQDSLINNEKKTNQNVIIGYFSGSITHNSDIEMIKDPLLKILKEFKNVKILLSGELSFPKYLNEFKEQIIIKKFTDWRQLPKIISNIDINIAPIEKTIFNEAKSENKWVEAALVQVPTIASNYGEFKNVIIHNETGLLCSNLSDWYITLKNLIINQKLRKTIGKNAYNACKKEYNTIYTGKNLANYINSISNKHIGFYLPSLNISGGIYVILKHACILQDEGWDVDLIVPSTRSELYEFQGHQFNLINLKTAKMKVQYDILVATLYSTLFNIFKYDRVKKLLYLVQNYETDFYSYNNNFRSETEKTYLTPFKVVFITISQWCKSWLWRKYKKFSRYAPNGIDFDNFYFHKRQLNNKKIIILIEGDSSSHYKNVDESFKIVEKLDKNKFEIWYLSYNGKPKDWYRVDKFLNKIPHETVVQIYNKSDILLKSSWLESFSYPPLEMMATGGYCIVAPNEGNIEYLKDEENCLFYKLGDINSAIGLIEKLITDEKLQQRLYENGIATAKKRNWKIFKNQIINLYNS